MLTLSILAPSGTAYSRSRGSSAAQYTAKGELIFPADYREWVFLTSGVNMNYSDDAMGMDHDMVDNVFVDPASWRAFKQTGQWPEGTVLVKEPRMGAHTGSINKSGTFQSGQRLGLEVHVKDTRRFKGGWAFFVHGDEQPAPAIPGTAACYSCHQDHGATETTFVQFYPTAKPIAVKAGTFDAGK
ncbi:MAG: hypothetical protein CFE35_19695 [Novosphingobium sp. PASSN1]|nr:MAG: hypothetical protein CFE35_19695 [Novosphingobium sp. PASSN1]